MPEWEQQSWEDNEYRPAAGIIPHCEPVQYVWSLFVLYIN